MARCPFAVWMPIPEDMLPRTGSHRTRKSKHSRINIHISAGVGNPFGFFSKPGNASSEFFINKKGTIFQFGDSDLKYEADFEGNADTHSIEHEGKKGPLTPEQLRSSAMLVRWLRETHNIRNQIATSSKPGSSSEGLSWHRLGIDGNFPSHGILAGRKQRGGGLKYSRSRGKICPTDEVILQIEELFRMSQTIDIGTTAPHPVEPAGQYHPSKPSTKPVPASHPRNKYGRPMLDTDGNLGPVTITELQRQLHTSVDGFINGQQITRHTFHNNKYSSLVAALQRKYGTPVDGKISYPKSNLVVAMQRHFHTTVDGQISYPDSALVEALQRALNNGTF